MLSQHEIHELDPNHDKNTLEAAQQPHISSIDQLKIAVDHALEQLKRKKYTINEPSSNLDLLLRRYQSKKSVIGSVAHWYGNTDWWKKIAMGLLIGAIGAGLGFLCHAPIVIAIISVVCYLIFAAICIEHYHITHKQVKLLCEDVIELEKSLNETVKLHNEFTEKLRQIYMSAYELNTYLASDAAQMEKKIETLNTQVSEYKKILNQLSESEKTIVISTSNLVQTIEQLESEVHKNAESLHQDADGLSAVNHDLLQLNTTLKKAAETLCDPQLYESYLHEYEHIAETAKDMKVIVDAIKSHPHLQAITTHSSSTLIEEVDTIIQQSNELLESWDQQSEKDQLMMEQIALAKQRSQATLQGTNKVNLSLLKIK